MNSTGSVNVFNAFQEIANSEVPLKYFTYGFFATVGPDTAVQVRCGARHM